MRVSGQVSVTTMKKFTAAFGVMVLLLFPSLGQTKSASGVELKEGFRTATFKIG